MKLHKCTNHEEIIYTLKETCEKCKKETKDAHYKFVKLKDVVKTK